MKPLFLVPLCVAASSVTAYVVTPAGSAAGADDPTPRAAASLADASVTRDELDSLRDELRGLAQRLAAAERRPAVPTANTAVPESPAVDPQTTSAMDAQHAGSGEATYPGGTPDARSGFLALLDAGLVGEEAEALWDQAAEAGQLHELLEAMEEHMAGLPETAVKHADRARAYYEAARALPTNEDGNWWVDSDDAYSHALELDPDHWDARYEKARNMSFWPVAYGGQAQAIRHFEVLVESQRASSPSPREAKTYVWLGNLYDQQGRRADAEALWREGLARHPQDDWLRKKVEALD